MQHRTSQPWLLSNLRHLQEVCSCNWKDKLRQRDSSSTNQSVNLISEAVLTASITGGSYQRWAYKMFAFFCERQTRAVAQMFGDNQRMRLQGETISHSVIKTTKHPLVEMPNTPLFTADSFPRHSISFLYRSSCRLHIYSVHRNRWNPETFHLLAFQVLTCRLYSYIANSQRTGSIFKRAAQRIEQWEMCAFIVYLTAIPREPRFTLNDVLLDYW